MKRLHFYCLLPLAFLLLSHSCSNGGGDNPPIDPGQGQVSQYTARPWDGVKRAEVFYEIFVRSFADSDGDGIGDLKGVADKLDYLHGLGIGGIWLTPIHPSPSYHGYDVEDYKAVDPVYGTVADFEALTAKARSMNIKVVMDFVVNHTSKTHPWFEQACTAIDNPYRDYYLFAPAGQEAAWIASGKVPMTKTYVANEWHNVESGTTGYRYQGMFSPWMPELNYGPVETAEQSGPFAAICEAARFWLDKGADGFRLDAVKHIYQDGSSDENPEFLRKFYAELARTKPGLYMVGEVYGEHNETAPYYKGLPAVFEFSGWWRLEYAVNNHHAKWFPKDLLDYRREYAVYRSDFIQATKLSNHDEDRTRTALGGRLDRARLAAAVLLTVSGSPYIYYGEEIGMLGSKASGDENVRDPFLWEPLATDSYRTKWRTSSFSNDYTVGNVASQRKDPKSIFRLYEKFIELRNTYPALAVGEMSLPEDFDSSDDSDKYFMVFYRTHGSEKLLVVHNVSDQTHTYTIRRQAVPIADQGAVAVERVNDNTLVCTMPPYSSLICEL